MNGLTAIQREALRFLGGAAMWMGDRWVWPVDVRESESVAVDVVRAQAAR